MNLKSDNHGTFTWMRAAGVFAALLFARSLGAQTLQQTVALKAGWNAVWVTVQPTNNSITRVFAGLPVESVWTYTEKLGTAQFIRNQNELPWGNAGWRRYLTDTNRTFLTTLFTVDAHRAYLVRTTNAGTLTLTGTPIIRAIEWAPDAFSLRGFCIDDHEGPTVANFFAASPAHVDQPVYELQTNGVWQMTAPEEELHPGRAYWIYTRGGSQYQGPWTVSGTEGDGVDFGLVRDSATIRVQNYSQNLHILQVEDLLAPSPLSQQVLDGRGVPTWQPVSSRDLRSMAAGQSSEIQLSLRRADMAGTTFGTVLRFKGSGLCYDIAVNGAREASAGGGGGIMAASGGGDSPRNHVGLWVGSATVDAVSEPHAGPVTAQQVGGQASLARALALPVSGTRSGVLREVFTNIVGETVASLTSDPRFPSNPSFTRVEPNFEAPTDFAEAFGQRMRAQVIEPANGVYRFGIASDDSAELWMSSDETPAHRALIAAVPAWTASREFLKFTNQISAPVTLRAGQSYYLEALMKEGFSGDHLAVTWQMPGAPAIANGHAPIPGAQLAPYSEARPQIVPTPTANVSGAGSSFPLRLLVHVNGNGDASFLKEVIQLWRDGGYTTITGPNDADVQVADTNNPGRHVLLTDDSRLVDFKGVGYRQGAPVGRRISTIDFDFAETHLPMAGSFAKGGTNQITLVLSTNAPTNPFRHRQHPDHDNYEVVNNQRRALPANRAEVFSITRSISLEVSPSPLRGAVADYGYNVLDGTYRETITGLHQKPLLVQGKFRLTRVATSGELNPPAPAN